MSWSAGTGRGYDAVPEAGSGTLEEGELSMNTVTAQVNLHPPQEELVGLDLCEAMNVFRERGLGARTYETSTLVWGEEAAVLGALREVFHRARELDDTVMTVTLWSGSPDTDTGRARSAIGEARPCQVVS
jgi:hypothetical protein